MCIRDRDLAVIVCINKIDRPEARPAEVIDETLELMMDLDASDEQLDCPFIYASARGGFARYDMNDENMDMSPLFETIIEHIPAPEGDPEADTQVLISTIDYNEFVGRIGIGKIDNGGLKVNQECVLVNHHDPDKFKKIKICLLYTSGIYEPFAKWAGAGAGVPLLGFGNTLWKGVKEAIGKDGILGIFKGGLTASSAGICGALVFGYLASLVFKPKMK